MKQIKLKNETLIIANCLDCYMLQVYYNSSFDQCKLTKDFITHK